MYVTHFLVSAVLALAQLALCVDVFGAGYVIKTGYKYNSTVKQQYSVTSLLRCSGACLKSDVCVAVNARCPDEGPGCECDFLADVAKGIEELTQEAQSTYMGPAFSKILFLPDPDPKLVHPIDPRVNISHTQRVRFGWKACHTAIVMLSPTYLKLLGALQIMIGGSGNTQTTFRIDGVNTAAATTNGILNCNEYRKFWAFWDDSVVRFGKGWIEGEELVLEHSLLNDSVNINHLALTTQRYNEGYAFIY